MRYKIMKKTKGEKVWYELHFDKFESGVWEWLADRDTEEGIRKALAEAKESAKPVVSETIEIGDL